MHILIADAHPLMRIAVAGVLRKAFNSTIAEAGTIADLRASLVKRIPELLVMECAMPCGDTLEAVPDIRRAHPQIGILILSGLPEHHAGVRAILTGAQGYLHKSCSPQDLLAATERIVAGERYISSALGVSLAEHAFDLQSDPQNQTLSNREFAVLLKISQGLTTAEIAHRMHLSSKTVGTYRARIRKKTRCTTNAGLTRYVIENGLDERT